MGITAEFPSWKLCSLLEHCVEAMVLDWAAGLLFARGASRCEARELEFPLRGSAEAGEPAVRLASGNGKSMPLIPPFFPHYSLAQGCFVDRLPDYRGHRGCRQFWVAGARFLSGGGQITHLLLGRVRTLGHFASRAEMRAD